MSFRNMNHQGAFNHFYPENVNHLATPTIIVKFLSK